MKWLTLKKRIFDKQRKQTTWSGLLRLAEFVKNSRDKKKKKMDVISSDKKIRNDAVSSDKNSSNKNQWMLFVVVTVF